MKKIMVAILITILVSLAFTAGCIRAKRRIDPKPFARFWIWRF